jgi:hypothetical protein
MLFLPALFGIFVLMAFLGWGELVALACGQKKPVPAGTLTFLGASCIIFLGGLLNLLHALGLGASVGLLAIGFLAFFRWPKRIPEAAAKLAREARATPLAALALLAAWVAIIVLYLSFCRGWRFGVDDLQGYLTWPEKALQTGWLGDDPFSLRRFSGLGSNSFLQSLVLSFFPLPNTTVIEPAVAFLMIALFAQEKSVGPRRLAWAALSLAIMATCFVFAPRVNTSSLILPIGFVMVLIVYCCETAVEPLTWAAAAWLALFATPLTSLKGNVAPFAPLALTAFFILRGLAGRNILREGIRAIVFYFALLLPWLLSSHGSTGSWYYPLVGKSYLVTSYHDVDGLMRVEKGPMDFYYAFVNCTIYPVFLAAIILPLGAILAVAGRRAQKCWIAWLTLGYALLLFVLEKHRVLFLTWEILGLVSVAITAVSRPPHCTRRGMGGVTGWGMALQLWLVRDAERRPLPTIFLHLSLRMFFRVHPAPHCVQCTIPVIIARLRFYHCLVRFWLLYVRCEFRQYALKRLASSGPLLGAFPGAARERASRPRFSPRICSS